MSTHSSVPFRAIGIVLIAAAAAAIGMFSLYTGDSAYTWQPVPADIPGREWIARVNGLILVIGAATLIVPRTRRTGAAILALTFLSWVLLLHLPRMVRGEEAAWLGLFEMTAASAGCWAVLGLTATGVRSGFAKWSAGPPVTKLATLCFAVALPFFGLSHFKYAVPAASMLPAWMPGALALTYLTGAGHVAAGLSLLTGVLTRIASSLLCFMLASFVFLLHVPRVLNDPHSRYEWTMLSVSVLLSGAAWVIAAVVHEK